MAFALSYQPFLRTVGTLALLMGGLHCGGTPPGTGESSSSLALSPTEPSSAPSTPEASSPFPSGEPTLVVMGFGSCTAKKDGSNPDGVLYLQPEPGTGTVQAAVQIPGQPALLTMGHLQLTHDASADTFRIAGTVLMPLSAVPVPWELVVGFQGGKTQIVRQNVFPFPLASCTLEEEALRDFARG